MMPMMALSTRTSPSCLTPGCSRAAITGDGPAPCWACLYRFGRAAADPEALTDGEVVVLLEAHGDVVELYRHTKVVEGKSFSSQRWRWRVE
jgi:hypothetical protein